MNSYNSNYKSDRRVILETDCLLKQYWQYDTVVTAVNRVTFRVHEGEFVAITGDSGSGKSTLLNVISAIDVYDEGEIFYYEEVN